ncbi:MAG: DUF4214 domain-containing protein [Lachnospiraceae bacterium]|nr:DUF4214 domain-containing protein [Lachnospiraceae bacterium]
MIRKIHKYLAAFLLIPMVSVSVFSGGISFGSMQVQAAEMPTEGIMTDPAEYENGAEELTDALESETAFEVNKLNYVYLDAKTVYTPSAQTVMVSYGDEQTQLAEAKLTVQNYLTGSQTEYSMADTFENTALFSLDYTASDRGIYEITDLHIVTTEGYAEQIHLRDTGMEHIYFGVDEEFEETDDADKALTAESYQELTDAYATMQTESESANGSINSNAQSNLQNVDLSQIEFQIVSLGSDGSQISTSDINDIKKALEAGETTVNKNARLSTESALSTEAEDYVVMLDPGHDATHCGANKNGLREEVLTLKIAQYCKAELEQYKHVKVYMTRESAACPLPGSTSVADNLNRVATAANVGADIYVSIHLNSAGTSTAKGAEVFYPNSNYRPGIGSAGANLATQIQRQLVALGLNNRGISIRNSGDGSRYPDGSLADYYAVIKHSKNAGFPGVIVEHAYVSNASDAAFLKSESNLQALGIADATGIASYLGLSKGPDIDREKVLAFVTRLYNLGLNRAPEAGGLDYWTDIICSEEMSGAEVAQGFFFSQEMENRNLSDREFVEILYNVLMDRTSDSAGISYWLSYMNSGIEREAIFKQFVESPEYYNICESYGIERGVVKVAGRNRNPGLTLFMMRLYTKAMGREYDRDGLDYWCNEILDGNYKILEVAGTQFFNSKEFLNKKLTDKQYVQVLYRTFFDREYDDEGMNYWLAQMKKGMTRNQVLEQFNNSKEFEQIRANYGIIGL